MQTEQVQTLQNIKYLLIDIPYANINLLSYKMLNSWEITSQETLSLVNVIDWTNVMAKWIVVSPIIVFWVQIPAIAIILTTTGQLLNPKQPTAHERAVWDRLPLSSLASHLAS